MRLTVTGSVRRVWPCLQGACANLIERNDTKPFHASNTFLFERQAARYCDTGVASNISEMA